MIELGKKAPFPYFGGKSRVADIVWSALGNPKHYIEPFAGSCAVLLNRPDYHPGMIETINDKDGFVSNVWRSMRFSPDETAKWCDWPVNHADLMARKKALIKNESRLLENLTADDRWHDPVMAGYWIWAASCWIGSGLTSPGQRPHLGDGGKGVHALGQIPHLGDGGKGVHAIGKIPHLVDGGKGVHAIGKIPLTDGDKKNHVYNTGIYLWFRELSERLRYVRVCCGDWSRVCGGSWQDMSDVCGMFFDPPYAVDDRDEVYHHDSFEVAREVQRWCIERGELPSYRIVLAGYDEHDELVSHGWRPRRWKAQGGYGNRADGQGKENAKREVLWFSPHCLDLQPEFEFDEKIKA